MSFTHTISKSWGNGGTSLVSSYQATASVEINLDESINTAEVDKLVEISFNKDALKTCYIVSDQDITIETNNGAVPVDTITLKANQAKVWTATCGEPNPFAAGDVTAFYVTNASGQTALLKVRLLLDATP